MDALRWRWFGTVLVLILLVPFAHAAVDRVTIEDRLSTSDVRETLTIDLNENNRPSLSFGLPPGAKDVLVNGKTAVVENGTLEIGLTCKECRIALEYTIPDAVVPDSAETLSYSRTLNLPQRPATLQYSVILPTGAFVSGQTKGADPGIVPQESAIRTDGKNIIVEWNEEDPALPTRYFVRFSTEERSEGSTFLGELGEWQVWVIAILALCIGAGLGVAIQRFRGQPLEMSLPYVPASLLSPDERKLLKLLEKHKPVWQKEIIQRTNWSKSKVSAIVTNLDHKGIVTREKLGRSYKVTLVKEMGE